MNAFARSLLLTASIFTGACGTMNAARPLDAGHHQVGVTFGGPFTTQLGPPIPVPNIVVEGRSGLDPLGALPIDINYGLNVTPLLFGVTGLHTGVSVHPLAQHGARPALSFTERVLLYNNLLDSRKPADTRTVWALNELDATASWALGHHLVYAGVSNALDLADPELLVSPFLGTELRPRGGAFAWQFESRWLGANFSPDVYDVSWLNTGDPGHGLFTFTVSAAWNVGKGGSK